MRIASAGAASLLLAAGCSPAPPPAADPAPSAVEAASVTVPAAALPDCVMPARDGEPERRWARVPPPYADSAAWFRVGPITFRGRRGYLAYGNPYVLFPEQRVEVGEYRGVRVFALAEEPTDAFLVVIFLPMSQGCEFQGYNYLENSGPVRGGR